MIRVLGSITDGFWEEVVIKCAINIFLIIAKSIQNYFLLIIYLKFYFIFQVSKVVQVNKYSFTDFFSFLFPARLQMGILCLYVRCTDAVTTVIVQFTQPIQVNVHVVAVVL